MRPSCKTVVSAIALFGLFTLSANAEAKSPTSHNHGPHHSMASKSKHSTKPQNVSRHGHTFAKDGHMSAAKWQTAAKKHSGPVFNPNQKKSKAEQAKEIHDQRTKDWPIFVPTSKAQQAKEIHDQRVKDARNGGPIFVPTSKAQQAKDIHDERMKNPRQKSKAEQAKEIHDQRVKQQRQQSPWDTYPGSFDTAPAWLKDAWGPPPA